MSIFKCKMCGGTIEFEPGATVGICDSCGTKQTLPRLDDDRRANLYDRANHFRRNNEFDKASGVYEQMLNEDPTDAEAYWSLVLCRYGIEYVEDPATHKRVPTVNRTQFTSIFDDEDYKSALQHADGYQRSLYEKEASAINEIQKGILAISQKEKPFDVFICYKETDANGRRTPDSVLANDLYHQLTLEGFKVFFARITLEDKLGTAYEPYIFAALNSAKVMVVLGTKPENFNAVWVKNEWSRYLSLVKASGGKKVLIPAYRDMDPYDLPEEFSHLMAQDMSKLGFMQDLIRGIKKIARADEPKATVKETVVVGSAANVAPLLKRAFMFLEDGEWSRADDFCEQVLNQDPENAQAYLGKLMAELRVHRQVDLADCEQPFDRSNNYQKAVRFGDAALSSALRGYIDHINERNENARLTGIYNNAVSAMKSAVHMSKTRLTTQTITILSLLVAIEIVLSRFLSFSMWNTKIGFSFVPIVVAAVLFGPLKAGIVAALADFIEAILFPIGTYFPGFTLTAFLTGCVYGFFLYKKQGWPQIIASVGICQLILNLLLNTLWISILYGSPYGPLLVTRIFQTVLLAVVQMVCIPIITRILNRYRKEISAAA